MLSPKAKQRVDDALAGVDLSGDPDQLYRQLFPDEISLHDFRQAVEDAMGRAASMPLALSTPADTAKPDEAAGAPTTKPAAAEPIDPPRSRRSKKS